MDIIDMHTHSTASDGSLTPAELVRYAKKKGLKAIAITDHDTIAGLDQAVSEGKTIGIEVIPGLEISVDFFPEMHLLGYFFTGDYRNISSILDDLKGKRAERNPKIIRRLNELGFDIKLEEAEKLSGGNITGRPHIAKVMLNKGYVGSINEAFDKYLLSGRPAYVKKDKLTPEQGIEEIARAGGIPVLAHPIFLYLDYEELDALLKKLVGAGLKGIEAYYVENTDEQTGMLLKLAEKHKLLVTGGSDFHGNFKPDIDIGVGKGNLRVSYKLLELLKNRD